MIKEEEEEEEEIKEEKKKEKRKGKRKRERERERKREREREEDNNNIDNNDNDSPNSNITTNTTNTPPPTAPNTTNTNTHNNERDVEVYWSIIHELLVIIQLYNQNKNCLQSHIIINKLTELSEVIDKIEINPKRFLNLFFVSILHPEYYQKWNRCCLYFFKKLIASKFNFLLKQVMNFVPFNSPGSLCRECLKKYGDTYKSNENEHEVSLDEQYQELKSTEINRILDSTVESFITPNIAYTEISRDVKAFLENMLINISRTGQHKECLMNCRFHLFGSSATGLQAHAIESDVDLMIQVPPPYVNISNKNQIQQELTNNINDSDEIDHESRDSDNSNHEEDEEDEEDENENEDEDGELGDTLQLNNQRRITIIANVNQEMKNEIKKAIDKRKKQIQDKQFDSDRVIQFLLAGNSLVVQYETELQKTILETGIHPEAIVNNNKETKKQKKLRLKSSLNQQSNNLNNDPSIPTIDILKVIHKNIGYRKYPGIEVTDYVRHSRVPVIKLKISLPSTNKTKNITSIVNCDLTSYTFNPLRNTAYITSYIRWDQSNKLKSFLLLVKRFVSCQKIHGAVNGYLSSYTWVMLVFHFLLRLRLIPSMELISNTQINQNTCNIENTQSFGFRLNENNIMSPSILSTLSLSQLFKSFLKYYVTSIDIFSNVITLRKDGQILEKSIWKKSASWRLSIEDPFERADSIYTHDLGTVLYNQTQQKTFEVLRFGYETMQKVEILCQEGNLIKAGELFYSLFEPSNDSKVQQKIKSRNNKSNENIKKNDKKSNNEKKKEKETEKGNDKNNSKSNQNVDEKMHKDHSDQTKTISTPTITIKTTTTTTTTTTSNNQEEKEGRKGKEGKEEKNKKKEKETNNNDNGNEYRNEKNEKNDENNKSKKKKNQKYNNNKPETSILENNNNNNNSNNNREEETKFQKESSIKYEEKINNNEISNIDPKLSRKKSRKVSTNTTNITNNSIINSISDASSLNQNLDVSTTKPSSFSRSSRKSGNNISQNTTTTNTTNSNITNTTSTILKTTEKKNNKISHDDKSSNQKQINPHILVQQPGSKTKPISINLNPSSISSDFSTSTIIRNKNEIIRPKTTPITINTSELQYLSQNENEQLNKSDNKRKRKNKGREVTTNT